MGDANPTSVSETPVKSLLRDYFLQFSDSNIIDWCRIHHKRLAVIPSLHRTAANLISSLMNMPTSFVQPDSLWYIPPGPAILMLECKVRPGEIWGFQLCYDVEAPAWDEDHLKQLGEQEGEGKQRYSALLSSARAYLVSLAQKHPELRGIGLELDKDTLSLSIQDSAVGVKFTPCLYVRSWIMTPEEVDAVLGV